MKYQIKVIKTDDNEFFHSVFENATGLTIKSFFFEDDAENYMKFLENGGVFNGFTPAFILNKASVDIDSEFNILSYTTTA